MSYDTELKNLIAAFYRCGAIDVGTRDELNGMRRDGANYCDIAAQMAKYVKYTPKRTQTRWQQSSFAKLVQMKV